MGREARAPLLISFVNKWAPETAKAKEVHFPESRCKALGSMESDPRTKRIRSQNFCFLSCKSKKASLTESTIKPSKEQLGEEEELPLQRSR